MTRVLDALKALEERRNAEPASRPRPATPPEVAPPAAPAASPGAEVEMSRQAAKEHAVANMCVLPTVPVVADHYHELAERIGEQLATNYSNVMLFVRTDDAVDRGFSLTHLAQAFSLQSSGDVLLVDGDLAGARLSKSVCPAGEGISDAMLGKAQWPAIIHSTTTPRIDFVSRGESAVPAEEPEFGWSALRPKYRTVLIGLADARCPETAWLATHCDAVYLLISRPHTQRDTAAQAVEKLRACGAHLMGSILVND